VRIPGAERAVVDIVKLSGYSLNPLHPKGRHKARVFASRLGLTARDAERLRNILLQKIRESEDAIESEEDSYGRRFLLDFEMEAPKGTAPIRSGWVIREGEDFPRLTTCFVRRRA
jgi:hypothetical protein